jgi:hypothetical protein
MFLRIDPTGATRRIVVANADGSSPVTFAGPADLVGSMAWVQCP